MAEHAEAAARLARCRLGLWILEQHFERAGRTRDLEPLAPGWTETQAFLPPSKFNEAELMQ